jgi:hypothetical protein
MWPYSYEACDIGTLKNQTRPDGTPNAPAGRFGDWAYNYDLSWLPGQRMSSCTCQSDDHPGPKTSNGKWKARSAPELDIFEAQVTEEPEGNPLLGSVSQSCQFAPFNAFYSWDNVTGAVVTDPTQTMINGFKGTMYGSPICPLTFRHADSNPAEINKLHRSLPGQTTTATNRACSVILYTVSSTNLDTRRTTHTLRGSTMTRSPGRCSPRDMAQTLYHRSALARFR